MEKIKIVTAAGCPVEIDSDVQDNWELLELMSGVDDDPTSLIKIFKCVLGDGQYKAVKENLKAKDGKVSVSAMAEELKSIFENAVPNS